MGKQDYFILGLFILNTSRMGGKNEHAHEHLQFYTFNMSLLGRKKGKRTGLLKSPVQCIPTQKTEQELHSISSGFTVDWRETAALCDK